MVYEWCAKDALRSGRTHRLDSRSKEFSGRISDEEWHKLPKNHVFHGMRFASRTPLNSRLIRKIRASTLGESAKEDQLFEYWCATIMFKLRDDRLADRFDPQRPMSAEIFQPSSQSRLRGAQSGSKAAYRLVPAKRCFAVNLPNTEKTLD